MTRILPAILAFLVSVILAAAQVAPVSTAPAIPPVTPILARHGMVVAQEARAARIGVQILDRGGNAVDAAVAVGFALAVTYPRAGNIGGGGFMVIHLASGNRDIASTTAKPRRRPPRRPCSSTRRATPIRKSRATPALPSACPAPSPASRWRTRNTARGSFHSPTSSRPQSIWHKKVFRCGTIWRIRCHARASGWRAGRRRSRSFSSAPTRWVKATGSSSSILPTRWNELHRKVRKPSIKAAPPSRSPTPCAQAGGIMTKDDLANYRAVEREVVRGSYRGNTIVSMPPPSSGGVALIEMLNILEGYDLAKLGRGEQSFHYMIEAMKRAYADRAVYMGDPDAVKMPVAGLLSKKYAAALRAGISDKATPAADIHPGKPGRIRRPEHHAFLGHRPRRQRGVEHHHAQFSFGLGLVADGTGVLLNNELDDFTAKPGTANAYGLVGFNANLPGPGKRPLSSMTPTIVLKDGKPFLVTGSPGGSRIITAVLQVITNVIDFGMPIDKAVGAPRLHNQWQPDETYAEPGFAPDVLAALERRGHKIVATEPHTSANSIEVVPKTEFTPQGYIGAADTRTRGALAAGY